MESESLLDLLDKGGTLALAVIIIVGLLRGWVVTRREFDNVVVDRDEWRTIALESTGLAERAVTVAEPRIQPKSSKRLVLRRKPPPS